MELKEMIYRRKSNRSYTGVPVEEATLQKIKDFSTGIKPLYPDIKVRSEIVGSDRVKCILPWTTPQSVVIFSEDKDGAMENVGFMYQQLDLYMQTLGLGVCWLGMGRYVSKGEDALRDNSDNLQFVIVLAFGYPKGEAQRKDITEFKRKGLEEIADRRDERLEPARLAPSSVNSQPWYFVHEDETTVHVYCVLSGLFKKKQPSKMNGIDIGIALAQLYIANPETFRFFKAETPDAVKGYCYIGSFTW